MKARVPFIALFVLLTTALSAQMHPGAKVHSSRHFYAPTAQTVPTDSIYLNWVGPLLDINFGINDKLTAGIGTPLFTGVYGTLSYGDQLNETGTIHGRMGNLTGFPVVGGGFYTLPYGALTFGHPTQEFTLAGGYFLMSDKLLDALFGNDAADLNPSSAVLNAGGYHQLNNRLGFAYEIWYLPKSDWTIVMPGVRFYTKQNRRYWNVGVIRLSIPYLEDNGYYDPNTNTWVEINTRKIQNITLPMFSFASYL